MQAKFGYQRPKERPKSRWKGDVENDVRKMSIVNWREETQNKDGRRATVEVLSIRRRKEMKEEKKKI
jgi:hypothetical protein